MDDITTEANPTALPMPIAPAPGSRSISVGQSVTGSALNAGDNNTISIQYQKTALPPAASVDIKAELAELKEVLSKIESSDHRKMQNALDDAQTEVEKPEPNKDEVGNAIDRALGYAKEAAGFATATEALKPHLIPIASWLGTNWDNILKAVGLSR